MDSNGLEGVFFGWFGGFGGVLKDSRGLYVEDVICAVGS